MCTLSDSWYTLIYWFLCDTGPSRMHSKTNHNNSIEGSNLAPLPYSTNWVIQVLHLPNNKLWFVFIVYKNFCTNNTLLPYIRFDCYQLFFYTEHYNEERSWSEFNFFSIVLCATYCTWFSYKIQTCRSFL